MYEEFVGQLYEDTGAIPGVRLGAGGAAVSQVFQRRNPITHQLMRLLALEVSDKPYAAAIVLIAGVV